MKAKIYNDTHIEGILYEHDLQLKESGPNSKNPGTYRAFKEPSQG